MDPSTPILFHDIASGPPVTTYAPNLWKARCVFHSKTEWVEHPEITSTRKKLGCPPVRWHRDCTPFYTLPIIDDPSTGKLVGDDFEIARYLDAVYPSGPRRIPPFTTALHRALNIHVGEIFILCGHGPPFNPETAEQSKAEFVRLTGVSSWDDITLHGAARTKQLAEFKGALGGTSISYADMIIGAWLQLLKASLAEWDEVRTWQNSRWGRVLQALDKYAEVKEINWRNVADVVV
ncbi:hypothetical protein B0H16DRAFT_1664725 [Mycena metata]|uniref:Glutathione S-transferase UstS-like C-terminal domain-containing protein n=1 Tax=Mycena metata TaxID=1033252 RepID=A0AAD7I8M8_9AGAR|nr:hypothetical protein B0H16DRAFT_1664725 [Mycena metata]